MIKTSPFSSQTKETKEEPTTKIQACLASSTLFIPKDQPNQQLLSSLLLLGSPPFLPSPRITLLYTLSLKPKNDQESPYSLYGCPESLSLVCRPPFDAAHGEEHSNGVQITNKNARLVAKVYTQVYGSDYGDTFSLLPRLLRFIYYSPWSLCVLGLFINSDHSVFYHHNSSGQCIYLVVYVDDIVITGSDQNGIQKLKQHIFTHFQTKDLGKLKKYALDILEETGMLDYKPVDTPMDPNVKLIPGQGEPLGDPGDIGDL
ncbi:hypothetical protein AAG906_025833 [Vitis piasezkii]